MVTLNFDGIEMSRRVAWVGCPNLKGCFWFCIRGPDEKAVTEMTALIEDLMGRHSHIYGIGVTAEMHVEDDGNNWDHWEGYAPKPGWWRAAFLYHTHIPPR